MNVRRFLQAGAVWAWPQKDDPLTEARERYTVTGASRIVESPWGRAMSFDGANDYFVLKDSEEFLLRFDSGSQDFSIAAWVRRGVINTTQTLFMKTDGGNDGWALRVRNDNRAELLLDARAVRGAAEILDTEWHCLVASVDRSGDGTLYIDGVAGTPVAISGDAMATTVLPHIGVNSTAAVQHWNGDIAGIVIWDRALSAAEAAALAKPGRSF